MFMKGRNMARVCERRHTGFSPVGGSRSGRCLTGHPPSAPCRVFLEVPRCRMEGWAFRPGRVSSRGCVILCGRTIYFFLLLWQAEHKRSLSLPDRCFHQPRRAGKVGAATLERWMESSGGSSHFIKLLWEEEHGMLLKGQNNRKRQEAKKNPLSISKQKT